MNLRFVVLFKYMPEKSDEEIAIEVQKGDIQSFGLLLDRYEKKMLRYARKFFSDKEDVKDIVQEVFIKVYANIRDFNGGRKFSPWIYRVAHNEFVNAFKKKKRMPVSFFDMDVIFPQLAAPETADGEANSRDLKQMLDRCLKELDLKYREPLTLYYFEQMDYKEIAEILKVPVSTVGVRLQRGRAILRKIINQLDKTDKTNENGKR
jgi:RNA polymerase sigma-70 factor, ECF subfamily